MPDEGRLTGWKETLLGSAIILAALIAAISSVRGLYNRFFVPTPGVVSLSAYFVDDAGMAVSPGALNYEKSHIKIKGDVSQGGQPVKNGSVRLTIRSTKSDLFQQSISIPLQGGHFETDDPAFRSLRPGAQIEIKADITAPGLSETATINLNSAPPVDKSALEYGLGATVLVLTVVFFLAFTGRKTAWRNQTAIIFSYLIIAIFLAVPILAPTLLIRTFPSAVYAMIGAPAGLVNTHTPNQPENETQWALNIGGYSKLAPKLAETPKNPKAVGETVAEKSTATQGGSRAGVGGPGVTGSSSTASNPPQASRPNPAETAATASTASVTTSSVPPVTPEVPEERSDSESLAPAVQVQGGLVIPLYVIILSVIGSAINMTRKVPGFQKEGEESDFSLARPISRVGSAVLNLTRSPSGPGDTSTQPAPAAPLASATNVQEPNTSLEDQAKAIDDQLVPLVTAQIQRNTEASTALTQIRALVSQMQDIFRSRKSDESLLKFKSFEDWAASRPRLVELLRGTWRVELLTQYMYLISAPFLAIVAYYLLDLLGLSRQGVVVVLSFSVGLISERIISWILGIATGYLRTDTGGATTQKT